MSKFKLIIKEINQGYVNVEAEDRDAAEEMALDEYNNGGVI